MTDDEVINELLARYNTPSAHGAGGVDKRHDPDIDAMEAYLARTSPPKRMPELRSYDPPWYQALPSKTGNAVDSVRGVLGYEPMGPEGYEWMRKLFGTENPLNLPGQAHEGYDTATRGIGLSDPKQAGLGAMQMAMALPLGMAKGPAASALKQEAKAKTAGSIEPSSPWFAKERPADWKPGGNTPSQFLKNPYLIIDRESGIPVGSASSLNHALRSVDRRDLQHGSVRYVHQKTDDYLDRKWSEWKGPQSREGSSEAPAGIRAYHGSPHDFDKFDMSKIGTGEGAQAYGNGLYFAENETVAKNYLNTRVPPDQQFLGLTDLENKKLNYEARQIQSGAAFDDVIKGWTDEAAKRKKINLHSADVTEALDRAELLRRARDAGGLRQGPGRMYEVNIKAKPEEFLDWDRPISRQSDAVRNAIQRLGADNAIGGGWHGVLPRSTAGTAVDGTAGAMFQAYRDQLVKDAPLGRHAPSPEQQLREAGIPGIRYKDAASHGADGGTNNYVVFDDALIDILRKYRKGGPLDSHGIMNRTNEAGYAPPDMPQRAFTDDYRGTTQGLDGSPLKTDIEGRPLTAKFVAGRRRAGENDVGLTPSEVAEIAQSIGDVKFVSRKELPTRAVGSFLPTLNEIKIAADLSPQQLGIALSHELGHGIAESVKSPIKIDAPVSARKVYHDLRTGDTSVQMPGRFHSPEFDGYRKGEVPGELIAEMLRAYMMDPNYMKTVAPKGAAAIRESINADPWLSKIIQFNALPPVALGAGALGVLDQYYGGDDLGGRRKYSSGGRTDNDTDGIAVTGDDQSFDRGVDFGPVKKFLGWASPAAGLAAYAISKRALKNGNELATPKLTGLATTVGGWSLATKIPDNTGDTLPPSPLPGETFHGPQSAPDWDTDVSAKRLRDVSPGPEIRAYQPSWTDRIGAIIAGEDRDPMRRTVAHRLLGTSGLGYDRSAPSQVLPVAPHAIDAVDRAQQGEYMKAAGNAALAATDVGLLRGIGKGAVEFGVKPFGKYEMTPFNVPFTTKHGKPGTISGHVDGTEATITSAYLDGPRFGVNSAGPKEIRRALDTIRSEFPHLDRVKAFRVSGARHHAPLTPLDMEARRAKSQLDMELTPMWRRYLNEGLKRGI